MTVPSINTNKPRNALVGTVLVVLAALLAVGCGSADAGTASSGAAPAQTTVSGGGSPIEDLIGVPLTDEDAMREYQAQAQRDAESAIAECMRAEGFDYTPVDRDRPDAAISVTTDPADRGFAEQHGFGLTGPLFGGGEPQEIEDPNEAYIESLTPAERDQFYVVLGSNPNESDSRDLGGPGGCRAAAFSDAFAFEGVFDQLGGELQEIFEAFAADPRIVEATSAWGTCMADAGYLFEGKIQALQDVAGRYEDVVNRDGARVDAESPALIEISGDDLSISNIGDLTPEGQAWVDEVAEEERTMAVASYDCDAPLREIEPDVELEYEQRFVDEHGDAVRAALAGDG